jgi:hypothetical protein
MRDQRGALEKRALSVLVVFHFVTDLAFPGNPFSNEETITAVYSNNSGQSE